MIKQLMKKPQPKQETSAEVSTLADDIKKTCARAEEYIETHALREKAENPLIGLDWIRMNLHLLHGRCKCQCALALLAKDKPSD
jgi:hypothetical protein